MSRSTYASLFGWKRTRRGGIPCDGMTDATASGQPRYLAGLRRCALAATSRIRSKTDGARTVARGIRGISAHERLLALLDDVAALAKVAAATIDDAAAQAGKAGAKAAGIVIDDAAVTPRYVTGLAAKRELPIIGRIALGSLKNKLLILLPAALLLSQFAPWAITPILMLGGLYLAYEGYEKVVHFSHRTLKRRQSRM